MAIIGPPTEVKDTDWIAQAFFVSNRYGGAGQQINRPFTSAEMKFYDTTPGGNKGINPKSQFHPNTDPRMPSLAAQSTGMGSYYSRAYDDFATRISIRCGIPRYNSLSRFLSGYMDRSLAQLVNTGEVNDGIFSAYTLGKALATIYTLPLQAYFGLTYLYTRTTSFLSGRPYSKFYYMEPTMPLFWSTANILANQLAVNMNLSHGYTPGDLVGTESNAEPNAGLSAADVLELNKILPDVFRNDSNSVIDLKSISSRAQRLQNQYQQTIDRITKNQTLTDEALTDIIQREFGPGRMSVENESTADLEGYVKAYQTSPMGTLRAKDANVPVEDAAASTTAVDPNAQAIRLEEPGLKELLLAELREGSAFITYEVDYGGSIGESFSNSTKSSGLQETINSAAATAKDNFVNFAGGNVGDGLIGGAVESTIGMVKDFLAGGADAVGFGGLASLGGAAFVDIPEVWENSTANLPNESYKFRLSTPYGNKMSIYLKIYLPLCGLLAMALPRSTGKSSYGAPFLCSIHSQGRTDDKLSIVDSLSLERGTSNVGFNVDGLPTAIDVTINFKTLNNIMHVPISDSLIDTVTSFSHFDEDSALTDYLSTLASRDLYSQFYLGPRLKNAWAKTTADFDSLTSPSHLAQALADTAPGHLLSAMLPSSDALSGL